MSEHEVQFAWACGLFEGEGTVGHGSNGQGATTRSLVLAMTDQDVVLRFAEVVGVGSVSGPHVRPNPRHKALWSWRVHRWEWLAPLAERMLPFMGSRRRQQLRAVLDDPPTDGRFQTACRRCGFALIALPGDGGRRRCPNCRPQTKREQEARRRGR